MFDHRAAKTSSNGVSRRGLGDRPSEHFSL
jgi:hypothetical protein